MALWWYATGNGTRGPLDEGVIKALLAAGNIKPTTPVWSEGMPSWRPICEIEAFQGASPCVPIPSPSPRPDPPLLPPSGAPAITADSASLRWRRFWARCFDLAWETTVVVLFDTFIALYLIIHVGVAPAAKLSNPLDEPLVQLLYALFGFPIVLVLDAAIYQVWGNTPGKSLLGLKVVTAKGEPLTFRTYAWRNARLWFSGLYCGIPVLVLFGPALQYSRLGRGLPASYDSATGHQVSVSRIGGAAWLAYIAAFSLLLLLWVFIVDFGHPATDTPNPTPTAEASPAGPVNPATEPQVDGYFWTSPFTQKTILIDTSWDYSFLKDARGQNIARFQDKSNRIVVELSEDALVDPSLNTFVNYTGQMQQALGRQALFSGTGTLVNEGGNPHWSQIGRLTQDSTHDLQIDIFQRNARVWRIVSVHLRDDNTSLNLFLDLVFELKTTFN